MSGSLRWGVLGTGGIAGTMTDDLLGAGHSVTAVGSRSRDSAKRFATEHGLPRAHGSYEDLVADVEVDAIYVATPHTAHAANALFAIEAGKHVLVEKPFTINAAEAAEVVSAAERRGVVVLEAMWTRFLPHMLRIREILGSGVLGEVRTVIAEHDGMASQDPEGRMLNPALGGGALLDLGIYPVSFAWDVFGRPETVQANGSLGPTGVDRQTALILGYPGGAQALLHTQLDGTGRNAAIVIGTEGRIEIDPVWFAPAPFTRFDSSGRVLERFDQPVVGRGMYYQAAALERMVATGVFATPELPPEESVAIMGTLDEARRQIGLRYPGEAQP
jgi:predicted dehydrogenase